MQCTRPIKLYPTLRQLVVSDYPLLMYEVPCGKCLACRMRRANEWSLRLMHELEYHEHASFITLTYNDDHLPSDNSLHKSHLQKFFKRLRKNTNKKLRYYANGEYGTKRGRPHYHSILFGVGPYQHDLDLENRDPKRRSLAISGPVKDAWTVHGELIGDVTVGMVTAKSCRYVTGYLQKDFGTEPEWYKENSLVPPFQLQSQGLGLQYAVDHRDELQEDEHIRLNGNEVGIPRYYSRKLNLNLTRVQDESMKNVLEVYLHWLKQGMITQNECDAMIRKARKQRESMLTKRQDIATLRKA